MYEALISHLRECAKYDTAENTFTEAADAIKELSNAGSIYGKAWTLGYDAGRDENSPRWIPVTEALPELDKRVFVIGLFGFCGIYSLIQVHDTTCWEDEYGYYQDFEDVTHWMPLPEPPKEE